MSTPYQVSPPKGNLLGSIIDFIGANRQLQLDAGTRNQINAQTGFGANVDPFQVQKYQGEGQRQSIAGNMDRRAQTEQDWQGADRTSQANVLGGLSSQFASDPVLGPIIANGGSNAMIGEHVLRMIGGDRTAAHQQDYANTNAGVDYAYGTARDRQQNEYRLQEIQAQAEGRSAGTGGGAGSNRLYPNSPEGIKIRQGYVNGTLGREDVIAAGVWDENLEQARADFKYNAEQAQLKQEAEDLKRRAAQGKPDPKQAAQSPAPPAPTGPNAYSGNPEYDAWQQKARAHQLGKLADIVRAILPNNGGASF